MPRRVTTTVRRRTIAPTEGQQDAFGDVRIRMEYRAEFLVGNLDRVGLTPETDSGLRDSIAQLGMIQPILITETQPGTWELLAGRRRLAAARSLQWRTVPATIVTCDNPTVSFESMVRLAENTYRRTRRNDDEFEAVVRLRDSLGGALSVNSVVSALRIPRHRAVMLTVLATPILERLARLWLTALPLHTTYSGCVLIALSSQPHRLAELVYHMGAPVRRSTFNTMLLAIRSVAEAYSIRIPPNEQLRAATDQIDAFPAEEPIHGFVGSLLPQAVSVSTHPIAQTVEFDGFRPDTNTARETVTTPVGDLRRVVADIGRQMAAENPPSAMAPAQALDLLVRPVPGDMIRATDIGGPSGARVAHGLSVRFDLFWCELVRKIRDGESFERAMAQAGRQLYDGMGTMDVPVFRISTMLFRRIMMKVYGPNADETIRVGMRTPDPEPVPPAPVTTVAWWRVGDRPENVEYTGEVVRRERGWAAVAQLLELAEMAIPVEAGAEATDTVAQAITDTLRRIPAPVSS